jgi:hypothetical protein
LEFEIDRFLIVWEGRLRRKREKLQEAAQFGIVGRVVGILK